MEEPLSPELPVEYSLLLNKVGSFKFLRREKNYSDWVENFIKLASAKGKFPHNAHIRKNASNLEIGIALNLNYWNVLEGFVRANLLKEDGKDVIINHYKIAATSEHIIMAYKPFVDASNNPLNSLNAEFAFYVTLQILFNWNIETEEIDITKVITLPDKKETKEFIQEHLSWLEHHAAGQRIIILSNMQTIRFLHYWIKYWNGDGLKTG